MDFNFTSLEATDCETLSNTEIDSFIDDNEELVASATDCANVIAESYVEMGGTFTGKCATCDDPCAKKGKPTQMIYSLDAKGVPTPVAAGTFDDLSNEDKADLAKAKVLCVAKLNSAAFLHVFPLPPTDEAGAMVGLSLETPRVCLALLYDIEQRKYVNVIGWHLPPRGSVFEAGAIMAKEGMEERPLVH